MSAKVSPKPPAKPGKDTIYIDVDDEITAIIDKVESAKQKIVALVLPKRTATLHSIVNMRLLKRSASAANKNVVLITSEAAVLPLAGAAGLHVAKNLQSKPIIPPSPTGADLPSKETEEVGELDEAPQKLDYHRTVGELAAVGAKDETETIALDNEDDKSAAGAAAAGSAKAKKASKAKKGLKVPNFDKFRLLLIAGIGGFVLLLVFIILAIWVLPKAKITIHTTSNPISANFDLTASGSAKELDEDKRVIPASFKTSDQTASQQVSATGQKNLGQKASGSATLKNCSGNSVTIPAGTGLGSGGTNFITQKSITLNSGNFTGPPTNICKSSGDHIDSVDVIAQSPGSKYNVNDMSVAASGGVTGSLSASGGTDNNVTVLTQGDVDKAKQKITSADSDKFSKDFQKQLEDQGMYVLTSTLKVGDAVTTSSPNVGEQTNNANVTVKITYSVITVQRADLEKLVKAALNKQVDQKKERISENDVLDGLTMNVQNQQANSPNATLSVSKDTTSVPIIDENAVKENAKGKKESEIKNYINTYPGVKSIDVKLSPFWVSKAPKKTGKIKVIQEQDKTTQKDGE